MLDLRSRVAKLRPPAPPIRLGPQIGVWGTFDLPDYGALLLLRIFERELRSRLPLAHVDAYSPLGYEHPIPMDGGRPALPLGRPELRRKRELADRHDLVVVAGEVIHTRDELYRQLYELPAEEAERLRPSAFFVDGLGPEHEARCPVVWSAGEVPFEIEPAEAARVRSALESRRRVSVRSASSRARLLATGSTREITVVPDPTILVSRLFSADALRKRIDYLRVMGWYPAATSPVFVEADSSPADLTSELDDAQIVLAELSPSRGTAGLADAPTPHVPGVLRLPAQASLEDIVAAIANARAVVATSPQARATAHAFGVPVVMPTGASTEEAAIDEAAWARLEDQVDAELDVLAALAERSWSDRAARDQCTPAALAQALSQAEERYRALLRAHESRGERLVVERLRFGEIVDRLEEAGGRLTPDAALRIAELENAVFTAQAAEAEARFELEELQAEREHAG